MQSMSFNSRTTSTGTGTGVKITIPIKTTNWILHQCPGITYLERASLQREDGDLLVLKSPRLSKGNAGTRYIPIPKKDALAHGIVPGQMYSIKMEWQ